MKVVLDTNVLVSGLLFGGMPGRILTAWSTGAIRLVIPPPILEEYRRVGLALSKGREPLVGTLVGTLEALLAMLTVHALLVDAPPLMLKEHCAVGIRQLLHSRKMRWLRFSLSRDRKIGAVSPNVR